jgi:hypothetical protein
MTANHNFDTTGCLFKQSIRFCFFFLLLFPFTLLWADILFESESVFVDIKLPDTVSVHGSYLFVNPKPEAVTQAILYPFPVDSTMGFPFSASIRRENSPKELPYSKTYNGILFASEVGSKDSARYHITYSQKVKGNNGRYILTTTQQWGRPLHYSALSVSIAANRVLKFVSFDTDSVLLKSNKLEYRFFFRNFMPVKDLIFTW